MKTRKLIKETGTRTDIFHTGDVAYCGKESELWYIVDWEKVMAHVEERLAKYKRLEGDVKFIDSIPKNASGKILKNALRGQAALN